MIKEIPKSDIIVRPMKVYKEWTQSAGNALTESDILPVFGIDGAGTFIDVDNDERTYDINGHSFVKKIIHASIKSQFYTSPATASLLTEVGMKKWGYGDGRDRILENEMAVFSIPQVYYGEGLKIGSVVLKDNDTGRTYVDDGYSNLIYNNIIYGNIFYDRGLVVLTKNVVSGSVLNNFVLEFRSTKTIYENEIFLSVLENEFNYSQNPSAVYEDGASKITHIINRPGATNNDTELVTSSFYDSGIKWYRGKKYPYVSSINPNKFGSFDDYMYSVSVDPTGSYLAPYITTIGLYDNELNMVAVAKLPQPVKSLPDYPLNFIVRFDT